ncbi:Lrp/AsnC family transcriptional regulator [Streptomyces sp. SAS_275]|uniref:Lrp/AsnC family transcriptional regulator n=1 Tax=Streptomyces sp. SAS_275 TaxID=3412746 RepID=UPI00403CB51B
MDDVDRSILAELERNGRISNNELAARVGLSPSPCAGCGRWRTAASSAATGRWLIRLRSAEACGSSPGCGCCATSAATSWPSRRK